MKWTPDLFSPGKWYLVCWKLTEIQGCTLFQFKKVTHVERKLFMIDVLEKIVVVKDKEKVKVYDPASWDFHQINEGTQSIEEVEYEEGMRRFRLERVFMTIC